MNHTAESRKKISEKRKKWLKENEGKHPWKRRSIFKSVPCENFKSFLRKEGVRFIEEFKALEDRYFSLDIAFPEKMIAFEINGNQHYEADGKLKPYYQNRHNLIEAAGWKVIEIHYSLCYNKEYIKNLTEEVLKSQVVNDFDYDVWENGGSIGIRNRNNSLEENCDIQFHYRPLDKFQYEVFFELNKEKKCLDCDKKIGKHSQRCKNCARKHLPKTKLPDKEELQKLLLENTMRDLAAKFGLTDNGLKKRCKQMNIMIPSNSFRMKKFLEKKRSND